MKNLLMPLLALKTKSGYSIFSALIVGMFSVWGVTDTLKPEVTVSTEGEEHIIKTDKETVGEVFDELGIELKEADEVVPAKDTELEDGMEITHAASKDVVVVTDGEDENYSSTKETVGELIANEEIHYSEHDELSHQVHEQLEDGLVINIISAKDVVIDHHGEEKTVKTTAETVEDLLLSEQIELKEGDKVKPKLTAELKDDQKIEVIKVDVEIDVVEEKVPFEVEEKKDKDLEKGKKKVITEGSQGLVSKTYKVVYENGEEKTRKLEEEHVIEEAKTQLVSVGTKVPETSSVQTSSEPAGGQTYTMEATAYTPYCNGCSGITAGGINIRSNPNMKVVAVDPSLIPLGSRVWVSGYGEAVAGDTGGDIKGNRIDLLHPSKEAAYKFGRRTVTVKVIK